MPIPPISAKLAVANVGRASRKDEKLLNTPAKQDSSPQTRRDKKGATSDPHDEMAPQKIGEILDGGWARRMDGGDETKRTTIDGE